jgi:hypothetical protein
LQESWLADPEAVIPQQRDHVIQKMNPVKIKKELSDHANLISLFGQNSAIVYERRPNPSWRSTLPTGLLEELASLSGWNRCEAEGCFQISMPNAPPLELSDSDYASRLQSKSTLANE